MRISDWSSDVCSSDLRQHHVRLEEVAVLGGRALHVERREAARVPAAEALQIVEPEPLRPQGCAGRAAENVILFGDGWDVYDLPQLRLVLVEIGREHVCTPVTNAHLVCRLLLEKKKKDHIE